MKGVSEVIAIILILMIVIALSALAYTWFSGIFASMTQSAGTAVTTTTNEMAMQFRIESAKWVAASTCTEITIRNTGTQNINASGGPGGQIAFFIDGTLQTGFAGGSIPLNCVNCVTGAGASCTSGAGCIILPQGAATYRPSTTTAACPAGTSMAKVSIGAGLTDSRTIVC